MNKQRCSWCLSDQAYIDYHDNERGVPVHDDQQLFALLILEGAQAGLSRLTILKKRTNYAQAFAQRDPTKVAEYGPQQIEELLANPGIIRNKLKIQSAINNAKIFLQIQKTYGSFDNYIWGFTNFQTLAPHLSSEQDRVTTSPLSDAISIDLKSKGMNFVGSTIIYAYLQAIGIVNGHLITCWRK